MARMQRLICRDFETWHAQGSVEEFPEDVTRLVRELAVMGFEVDRRHAEAAWHALSVDWSAGWLDLDGVRVAGILSYLEPAT